jgi:hypothetical protein
MVDFGVTIHANLRASTILEFDSITISRERDKARALRKSGWWQQKLDIATCYYCQKKTDRKLLTMDHIVPVSRGGQSTRGNVVTACKDCNTQKKDLIASEWTDYLDGRLN